MFYPQQFDPFAVLAGHVGALPQHYPQPQYAPQYGGNIVPVPQGYVGQGPLLGPPPPGTFAVPPGSVGPPPGPGVIGPPVSYYPYGCPAPSIPTATVEAVKRCTDPFGIESAAPIADGATDDNVTTSPQNPVCVKDMDIPRTVAPFFTINSMRFATCELLQNGRIHADTFASDSIHPCLKTVCLVPGQRIRLSVTNIAGDESAHTFFATFAADTIQMCVPCDAWA